MTNTPVEEKVETNSRAPSVMRRYLFLFIVLTLAVTLVGFLRGIKEPLPLTKTTSRNSDRSDQGFPAAVKYAEMPESRLMAFASQRSHLNDLKAKKPSVFDKVVQSDGLKQEALADRAKVRAYDSAPPVIPHGIDQMKTAQCLACHSQGIIIGERIASKVSHPHFTNCTQCHVELNRTQTPWATTLVAENAFEGITRAGPGARAWPGAPPTIPHSTWMRQDCTSCHGTIARVGIRSTHPWLTNCTQCHAPSAALDQVDFHRNDHE